MKKIEWQQLPLSPGDAVVFLPKEANGDPNHRKSAPAIFVKLIEDAAIVRFGKKAPEPVPANCLLKIHA